MMIGRRDVVGIALIAGAVLALGVAAWADCPGGVTGKTPCGLRGGYKVPITCQQSSDGLFAPDGGSGPCARGGARRSARSGACAPGGGPACIRARDCSCRPQPCPRAQFPYPRPCDGANSPCAERGHPEIGCPVCAKAALVLRPLRDGSVGLKVALYAGAKSCLALVLYGKDGVPIPHPDVLSAGIEGERGSAPIALQPMRHAWHGCFDVPAGDEYTVVVHTRMLGGATETAVFPLALSSVTRTRIETEDKSGNGK